MTKPDGGKGSKPRPTDPKKYSEGYDLIFKKKPVNDDLTITKNEIGQIVAVTYTDEEGRIVEVIATND